MCADIDVKKQSTIMVSGQTRLDKKKEKMQGLTQTLKIVCAFLSDLFA